MQLSSLNAFCQRKRPGRERSHAWRLCYLVERFQGLRGPIRANQRHRLAHRIDFVIARRPPDGHVGTQQGCRFCKLGSGVLRPLSLDPQVVLLVPVGDAELGILLVLLVVRAHLRVWEGAGRAKGEAEYSSCRRRLPASTCRRAAALAPGSFSPEPAHPSSSPPRCPGHLRRDPGRAVLEHHVHLRRGRQAFLCGQSHKSCSWRPHGAEPREETRQAVGGGMRTVRGGAGSSVSMAPANG